MAVYKGTEFAGRDAVYLNTRILEATLLLRGWRLHSLLACKRFNPNQPRVPRGYRLGGQWIAEGEDYGPVAGGDGYMVLAGHDDDDLPSLPDEHPTSGRERHRIARIIAGYLRDGNVSVRLGFLFAQYAWLANRDARDVIAYRDPPKSLEELRDAVADPQPGYEIHHIVERTPARREGFQDTWVESRENRVRIPKFKHWEITGWYGVPNDDFDDLSPREYLRGKSWEERMEVGLKALILFGVLEP